MNDDDQTQGDEHEQPAENEPREVTPAGLEVRTPTRGEFFANLKKVTKPDNDTGRSD